MQSFKIVAYLFLGYFWLVKMKILLIIKASLATAEVSAWAWAKADQLLGWLVINAWMTDYVHQTAASHTKLLLLVRVVAVCTTK